MNKLRRLYFYLRFWIAQASKKFFKSVSDTNTEFLDTRLQTYSAEELSKSVWTTATEFDSEMHAVTSIRVSETFWDITTEFLNTTVTCNQAVELSDSEEDIAIGFESTMTAEVPSA